MVNLFQFEDVLSQPDPREDLEKLVDPRLGDNYPLDSVLKVISDLKIHGVWIGVMVYY